MHLNNPLALIGSFIFGAHLLVCSAGPIDDLRVESDARVKAINARTSLIVRHVELASAARRLIESQNCRNGKIAGMVDDLKLNSAYSCRAWLREGSSELFARVEAIQKLEATNYGREMFSTETLNVFHENVNSATRVANNLRDAARLLSLQISKVAKRDGEFCSTSPSVHHARLSSFYEDYEKAKSSAKPNAMQIAIAGMYAESSNLRAKNIFCSSEVFGSVSFYAQQNLESMLRDSGEVSTGIVDRACALAKSTPQGAEACRMSRLSIEGAAVLDAFAIAK